MPDRSLRGHATTTREARDLTILEHARIDYRDLASRRWATNKRPPETTRNSGRKIVKPRVELA
jgi:hypothetical protein